MATKDGSQRPPTVLLLGVDVPTQDLVQASWLTFDVQNCNCYHAEDKARIVNVIDQFPGGSAGFNLYIRDLASTVLQDAHRDDDHDCDDDELDQSVPSAAAPEDCDSVLVVSI